MMKIKTIKVLIVLMMSAICLSLASADMWNYVSTLSPDPITDLFFINEYTGWAVGGAYIGYPRYPSSAIRKTTDGGITWTTPSYPSSITIKFNSVYFMNGTHGWVVGSEGIIVKTTDSGNTWSPLYFPSARFLDDIFAFNRTLIYVVGQAGVIYKTSNGGSSWTPLTVPTSDNFRAVAVPSATTVYVVGGNSVLKSTAGGLGWVNQGPLRAGGMTLLANDIQCLSATDCRIAASNGYICTTTTGGIPWTCSLTQSEVGFSSIFYVNGSTGWAVGGAGGPIQFTNDYSATWVTETTSAPLLFFTRAVQMVRAGCYTNNSGIGYIVADSSTGPSHFFRRGSVPSAPAFTSPECPSGRYTEIRDLNYCMTGYSCVEEQPTYYVVPEVVPTARIPRAQPQCVPVMNDCQAQFNPVYTYDQDGCAVSYTCVPRKWQSFRFRKGLTGRAFFSDENSAQGSLVMAGLVLLIGIIIGGLLYVRKKMHSASAVSKKDGKRKRR